MKTVTPGYGACNEFVNALVETGLLDEKQAARVGAVLEAAPGKNPQTLANDLVRQGVLSAYQADSALLGRAHDLVLSNFRLVDTLGSGSMGTVFKARSNTDGAWYAIKIVPRRNVVSLKAVVDKVRTMKEVRHPRVSALVQLGAQGERVYLAWPYIEGGQKLDDLVKQMGTLTPRQTVQIGSQVAAGMQAYHQHGLFHGLLKPSDILIGEDQRVRILDFGVGFLLACERGKSLLDTMTNTKALARGLDCAAPETHMNPLDRTPAGDRYSLGCILYYCLTGQYPFPEPNPVKKMLAHQCEEPTPIRDLNASVSPKLAAIVERLLSKVPDDRFYTTDELVEAFRTLSQRPSELTGDSHRSKSDSIKQAAKSLAEAASTRPPSKPPNANRPASKPPIAKTKTALPQPTPVSTSTRAMVLAGLAFGGALGVILAWQLARG